MANVKSVLSFKLITYNILSIQLKTKDRDSVQKHKFNPFS